MYRFSLKHILPIILLVFILPVFMSAESISELRAKINERNSQLAAIQKEIDKYELELEKVGAEKSTLITAIKKLDITRNKLLADVRKTQTEIDNETLNIQKLSIEISEKEEKIQQNNQAIAEAIRRINEADNFTMLEGVLADEKLSKFWETMETLDRFQVELKKDVERLQDIKDALFENKNEVEARRTTLVSKKVELDGKKGVVEQNKAETNSLLKVTKNKELTYQELLDQKIEQREQFEQELFEYESQLQFVLDPGRLPSAGKGILKWPLNHIRITQQFGKTSDSGRLYSSGTHNGIDFGVSTGTNVYAALGGVVEGVGDTDRYAGCLSYGKWVLIRHNNGLSTLYAHLSGFAVSVGEGVSTEQLIGYSGNTGYSTGPHLHLTVFASQGVKLQKLGDIPGRPITKCSAATIPVAPRDAYLDPLIYL